MFEIRKYILRLFFALDEHPLLPKEILYIIAAQEATNGSAFKVEGLKNLLFSSSFFSSILSQNIFCVFKDYHSGFFLNLLGYFWLIFTVLEPSKTFLEGFARFCCKIFGQFYILNGSWSWGIHLSETKPITIREP